MAAAGGRFGELHSITMAGCVALAPVTPAELYADTHIPPFMTARALADLVAERYLLVTPGGDLVVNPYFG